MNDPTAFRSRFFFLLHQTLISCSGADELSKGGHVTIQSLPCCLLHDVNLDICDVSLSNSFHVGSQRLILTQHDTLCSRRLYHTFIRRR